MTEPQKSSSQSDTPWSVAAIEDIELPEVDVPRMELQWMPLLFSEGELKFDCLFRDGT
jgi:hypothetical protein